MCVRQGQIDSVFVFVYHCSTIQLVRQVAFCLPLCFVPHSPVSPNFLSYRMQIVKPLFRDMFFILWKVAQRRSYTDSSRTFHPERSFYSAGARPRETW